MLHFFSDKAESVNKKTPHPTPETCEIQGLASIYFFSDILMKDMTAHRDWLKKQSKFKADEKKRRGQQKSYADIFGMEGSFRQLNID